MVAERPIRWRSRPATRAILSITRADASRGRRRLEEPQVAGEPGLQVVEQRPQRADVKNGEAGPVLAQQAGDQGEDGSLRFASRRGGTSRACFLARIGAMLLSWSGRRLRQPRLLTTWCWRP